MRKNRIFANKKTLLDFQMLKSRIIDYLQSMCAKMKVAGVTFQLIIHKSYLWVIYLWVTFCIFAPDLQHTSILKGLLWQH